MPLIEDTFTSSLAAICVAASAVPTSVAVVRGLGDDDLLAAQRTLADARRALDASASVIAGEIAFRSRRELGYDGLAQREGYRTPEKLVQHTTGSTARDASTLVHIGSLVHLADPTIPAQPSTEPWLLAVGTAVACGGLGLESAQAIRSGLGSRSESVTLEQLSIAVQQLLALAPTVDADHLFARARAIRDGLNLAGVALREQQLYEERSIRRVRRPNGLSRYIVDPDIESGAFWDDVYDKLTAPRRGGVSFVNKADRAWADAVASDERTLDQYVHDSVTDLLRIAIGTNTPASRGIIGSRQPAVRVLVTADALANRSGVGRVEGSDLPVTIATVERLICRAGTVPIAFDDDGQAVNVGREHRLFTYRQRIALAARDGGCLFGECDRPPEWCEAHHIEHWKRDHGKTNLSEGVLLCRHHHLLVHNNHWEIQRRSPSADYAGYWLIPPAAVDPERMPRLMPTKSRALRDLLAHNLRGKNT